jgi:phosphoribosylamine--glycine ligase
MNKIGKMNILLVGSGGREHALVWKLKQSPLCETLICAPGNPGIAGLAECVNIGVEDIAGLVSLAKDRRVDLVVVGPEAPLTLGLSDRLREAGIPVFGPSQSAARLEGL